MLAEIGPKTVDEGVTLNIALSATDPDGTFPSFAIENIPAGASLVDNGDGTGVFEWATTYADAGNYQLLFIASDGSLADTEEVHITVVNVNRPPVIVTNAIDTTIDECGSVTFYFVAPDPDIQATSMFAEGLVGGMVFEVIDTLGTFTFTPDTTQAGSYPVMVMATDGEDTTMVGFIITVEECSIEPPCANLFVSDTAFYVTDTMEAGEGPFGFRTLNVTSDLAACFTVSDTIPWLNAVPTEGCTPSVVTISYDATGLTEGMNYGYVMITGDSTVCESRFRYIPFILNLVDTSGTPVNDGDTLTVRVATPFPAPRRTCRSSSSTSAP